jgi:hypothetical protein
MHPDPRPEPAPALDVVEAPPGTRRRGTAPGTGARRGAPTGRPGCGPGLGCAPRYAGRPRRVAPGHRRWSSAPSPAPLVFWTVGVAGMFAFPTVPFQAFDCFGVERRIQLDPDVAAPQRERGHPVVPLPLNGSHTTPPGLQPARYTAARARPARPRRELRSSSSRAADDGASREPVSGVLWCIGPGIRVSISRGNGTTRRPALDFGYGFKLTVPATRRPGRTEHTRTRAPRSFVRWGAPPRRAGVLVCSPLGGTTATGGPR